MGRLKFTLACAPYDRVAPLAEGTVVAEGIDLNFVPLQVEEIFWRQLHHREFDGSEMSFSTYTIAKSRGDDSFTAIPVFTSLFFRHSCVYVNVHKDINEPSDLRGKTVGVPEYQLTAIVWLRGIFEHEYGVHPREIHWRNGGQETPGRIEKLKLDLPGDIDYRPIGPGKTLSEMLDTGEIDALFSPRVPSCFLNGSPNVARLFKNYAEVEKEYYLRTRIFPIMHAVVIKKSVYETNPWVAKSLYKACLASKELTLQRMRHTFALHTSLPWLVHHVDETRRLMGDDWWPYGAEKNKGAIETLCDYLYEQGLSQRRMRTEDLFAPETLDEFKI